MGEIRVLCEQGDVKVEWNVDDPESVEKAKAEFARLRDEGYEMYAVDEVRGKRVTKFDPKAGKLLAAPGVKKTADKERGTRRRAMAGGPNTQVAPLR